jgi:hypothetical protein
METDGGAVIAGGAGDQVEEGALREQAERLVKRKSSRRIFVTESIDLF